MNRRIVLIAFVALALCLAAPVQAEVIKAKGSVELVDPAGDVIPINTTGETYPGLDVVKLALDSDGQRLKISATLKEPPGAFASAVVSVYIDSDNNPNTGARLMFFKNIGGMEYKAELDACVEFDNGMRACTGGSSKAKPKAHYSTVNLDRFTGDQESEKKNVVDAMGFPGRKASAKTPITGALVQAWLDYADLKVKPGQTIRVLVREACASSKPSSLFPEIHLTLN